MPPDKLIDMTHPHDQLAQQVTQALRDADPDTLITTLHHADLLQGTPAQHISNLKPILHAAHRDHLSLLRPPPDFHPWLHTILATNLDGSSAKPNTRNARISTLRALYKAFRRLALLTGDPLIDFQTATAERADDPLPTRDDLDRLLKAAHKDPALHAAILLLWHHALPASILLRLKWSAFTPDEGTLLRGDLITPLTPQTEAALTRLHQRAGYDPLYPDTHGRTEDLRMFPYDTQDALRLRLRQVTRDQGLPFIPPGMIRRAALRDHPGTPQTLGYTRDKDYRKALRHAQSIVDHSHLRD
jgi:integrase